MKCLDLPRVLGLALAAAFVAMPAAIAGEAPPGPGPRPGLEIFDGAAPVSPGTGASGTGDVFSDPFSEPPITQPPYQPPSMGRVPTPPQDAPATGDGQSVPVAPYAPDNAALYPQGAPEPYGDPFYNLDDSGTMTPSPAPRPISGAEPRDSADSAFDAYGPPQPPYTALENLNQTNPNFPGLGEAALSNDLQAVGDVVWNVMKQRRVVSATMARGVRGSVGASTPYDWQRLAEVLNQQPAYPEDPLLTAQRVNVILDAFLQPMVDDHAFSGYMPRIIVRLHDDIYAVHHYMKNAIDDGVFLELSRTYIRAATSCDFFYFPRKELARDVREIMERASPMFLPDGASMGGDVAGITGNLFQMLLMLEHYTRNDSWFRRDLGSVWKVLEKPARYVLNVAAPDFTLPLFGPRGSRELGPQEVAALGASFPRPEPRISRIGLAATNSFPQISTQPSYGGVYVSQDILEAGGRYLAVRFGPWGGLRDVPTHADFGSLVLQSRGVKYLADGGGYGGWAAAASAHSGLSLGDKYVQQSTFGEPGVPSKAIWRTNASLDYATGMAGFEDGKTWQRSVLFVKNLPGETRTDYWMVLDHVDMKGDPNPQTARIRFHLAPGIQAYNDGSGIFASGGTDGSGVHFFAVDAGSQIQVTDGSWEERPGTVFDSSGGSFLTSSVVVTRTLIGDSSTATILYPSDAYGHRPLRIDRDSDIIRGRTGAVVIDHGLERLDVIAWAPPGTELVTPTLNLQLSADLAVFRVRRGKIARIDFINLERFQAKEPDGGMWSMRVNGAAQTLTLEPEKGGGWQVLADPANRGSADLLDVNFGPAITGRKFNIRPGEMRVVPR